MDESKKAGSAKRRQRTEPVDQLAELPEARRGRAMSSNDRSVNGKQVVQDAEHDESR